MSELHLEPLAATVTWRFEAPRPVAAWTSLVGALLERLTVACTAAGPHVIGHIKALATLPQGGCIRAGVVDIKHGADVQAGGKLPDELLEVTFTVNVLVYGLPRDVASRLVESAALGVAREQGGQGVVDIPCVEHHSYGAAHNVSGSSILHKEGASTVDLGKKSKAPWVFIGGTRGSAAMISGKQFEKFYLPYLKKAIDAIIAAGLTPLYHFDSDWTGHLPYFKQMPKAKCILEIDSVTDIFKAKDVLRGHTCIMGDVPATLFKLGTPEQVSDYGKKLIDVCGADGGFILSSGCEVPFDARWENVKAMVDTGKTYELSRG